MEFYGEGKLKKAFLPQSFQKLEKNALYYVLNQKKVTPFPLIISRMLQRKKYKRFVKLLWNEKKRLIKCLIFI